MTERLRGGRADFIDLDALEMESMSKEQREDLLKHYEYLKSCMNHSMKEYLVDEKGNKLGKILVFGMGTSDSENFEALKEMFYNPSSYNLVEPEHNKQIEYFIPSYMNKTLEERQKEWDNEHTGMNADLNMDKYKYGRPARPSEKLDDFAEKAQQPTGSYGELLAKESYWKNKLEYEQFPVQKQSLLVMEELAELRYQGKIREHEFGILANYSTEEDVEPYFSNLIVKHRLTMNK